MIAQAVKMAIMKDRCGSVALSKAISDAERMVIDADASR